MPLGRNRIYIDKNYGGTLIIWDKLFGTFQAELATEPVVYGLVHPVNSYNSFYIQFHHMFSIMKKLIASTNWNDLLSYLCKGPGWTPGANRLGDINQVPLVCIEYHMILFINSNPTQLDRTSGHLLVTCDTLLAKELHCISMCICCVFV